MHLRSFSEQMYAFTGATGKLGKFTSLLVLLVGLA